MHYVNFALTVFLGMAATTGCKPKNRYVQISPPEVGQVLPDSYEVAYQAIFNRSQPEDVRAVTWNKRYLGSWVRWTGTVKSFTTHSITLLQHPDTKTFDVSLTLSADQLARAKTTLKKGARVSYMGKFDQFDEIWRTIYLVQGELLDGVDAPVAADAGTATPPPKK